MAIDKDTVKYIANLARIRITDAELDSLSQQLSTILDYVNKLNCLNTDNVAPTSHVLGLKNVFRQDLKKQSLSQDAVLSNAPEKRDGFFVVPKVI